MKNIARLSALILCAALSLGTMTACEQKKVEDKPAADAPKTDVTKTPAADAKTPAADAKTPAAGESGKPVEAKKVDIKLDSKGMPVGVKVDTKAVKVDTTGGSKVEIKLGDKKVEVKAPTSQKN